MVTTWQLNEIRTVDPGTMRVRVTEILDGVKVNTFTENFPKTLTKEEVLNQLALFIKQSRQAVLDAQLPFKSLDLTNFETRIRNI